MYGGAGKREEMAIQETGQPGGSVFAEEETMKTEEGAAISGEDLSFPQMRGAGFGRFAPWGLELLKS